jgi:phosphoglycerate dehydrogenase-like enzyme
MNDVRPRVLIVFDPKLKATYLADADLARLATIAEWEYLPLAGGANFRANDDPAARAALIERVATADALVVCHGSPRIDEAVLAAAPRLRLVGELEGDRFADRIDIAAARARGIRVVDTTNGSSYPVSEWALGLMLIGLRNAGALFRRMIAGEEFRLAHDDFGYTQAELTGKRVGLIGGGHIARRLISFLKPFQVDISVHDPYIPKDIADLLGVRLTTLDRVLATNDVVVCLAPLTPATRRMIGARELDLIPSGAVLVNVSRGAIIDPDALVARLQRGDIVGCFDVFDPEPVPADNPIRRLPNVFLTPHIAGVTAASRPRFFHLMVDELTRFFAGDETLFDLTPRSLADRRGEPPPSR